MPTETDKDMKGKLEAEQESPSAIPDEIVDQLLAGYKKPDDLPGSRRADQATDRTAHQPRDERRDEAPPRV